MEQFRVLCFRGPATTMRYIVVVWARDAYDAYMKAQDYGYTPYAIE